MTPVSTPLSDLDARTRLAGLPGDARTPGHADLATSFAVEAGAGSGKTTALVGRVVALAEAGHGLASVVAITFTRRAAADLRARAYDALAARARALADPSSAAGALPDAPERAARVRAALGALDAACFDTIHGFCGRLLRADALAAGVPPDFAVAEEREAEEAQVDFWRRFVLERAGSPAARALAGVGLSPDAVRPLFETLSRHPDRLPDPAGAPLPDLSALVQSVQQTVALWQALRPDPPLGPRDGLQTALDTADRIATMRGLALPADQAIYLDAVYAGCGKTSGKAAVTLKRWRDAADAKPIRDTAGPALAARVGPALLAWQAYQYDAALAYSRDAVGAFEAERRASGRLTFDDLLHGAARLLRTAPHARSRAAARYRTFLVDEFQDTDPVQAEVLFRLAADAGSADAADWTGCRPRPGALCVVGDPKQSVYRFRRADIETYSQAVDLVVAAGGERLLLETCFRTRHALCGWINSALQNPFADDCEAQGTRRRQAPYVNLISGRPAPAAGALPVPHVARLDTPKVSGGRADGIAQAEADHVAAFVRAAVDGHAAASLYDDAHDDSEAHGLQAVFGRTPRFRDVLVVCRAASRFGHYAAAFERAGIPYTLGGDKKLGSADEAAALLTLLDAARDPLDGAARVAHRVGLLGGLSAPDLLVAHRHPLAPADPDGAHAEAVRDADAVVARARLHLAAFPVGTALERIAAETGLLALAATRDGGSERAGGLVRLLARARAYQSDGLHWTEVHDRLRDLVDGVTTDGRITLEEGSPDAVRILTAHQAKGLEAPVVFLVDPYSSFNPPPTEHTGRGSDGAPSVTAPLVRHQEYGSTLVAAPLHWHTRDGDPAAGDAAEAVLYDQSESRRVAYVAATRARGLLVVSRYTEKLGEGSWGLFHALLDDAPDLSSLVRSGPAQDSESVPTGDVPAVETSDAAPSHRAIPDSATRPTAHRRSPSAHVTDGADIELAAFVPASGVSYGSAYGSAVHGLFEWAVRNRHHEPQSDADRAVAQRLWDDQDAAPASLDAGLDALQRFRASPLWTRVNAAHQILCEVPVTGAGPDQDGCPSYLAGTVDLAFRDADGWHLVDYKTDAIGSSAEIDRLRDYYAPQVRAYASLWHQATNAAPASLALHFTDPAFGMVCPVATDTPPPHVSPVRP